MKNGGKNFTAEGAEGAEYAEKRLAGVGRLLTLCGCFSRKDAEARRQKSAGTTK